MFKFKKSHLVFTTALAALMLSGCGQQDDWTTQKNTAVCADSQGRRVADTNCDSHPVVAGASPLYRYYYLPNNSTIPFVGDRVGGGSYTRTGSASYFHAPASTEISHATFVSRGGFGASAHSFGVGE